MKTMNDLFLHFLQDIYYAEKAFAKSSIKIMKAVQNEEVREILKKPRTKPRSRSTRSTGCSKRSTSGPAARRARP